MSDRKSPHAESSSETVAPADKEVLASGPLEDPTAAAPQAAGAASAAPGTAHAARADGESSTTGSAPEADSWTAVWAAVRVWTRAYRVELALFVVCFVVFAFFSSQRFLRQSAAPHFVYQAQAFLEGRLDVDASVLPNMEDWACVREVGGEKVRCSGRALPTDKWYVSFPPFPAVVMMPFVALHGYQFNDTSFAVFIGALAIALFYSLLRFLSGVNEIERSARENVVLALTLAFGTVFFYCTLRGEVWFTAQVMGVLFTVLYVRNAVGARRPLLAGLFFAMATLTRTPLMFAGIFFLFEALAPERGRRLEQLRTVGARLPEVGRKVAFFAAGAAPLALAAAIFNHVRFGRAGEFGHSFFWNNQANAKIDRWGLFDLHYLPRNIDAAFLKLPQVSLDPFRLGYDPDGLSLLLTLPIIVFLFIPRIRRRLTLPLWAAVAVMALPGLLYQHTGKMQFGFRFSLDYTPYLLLLFAASGWSLKSRWVQAALVLAFLVNFWGAVAFKGYTEYVRNW